MRAKNILKIIVWKLLIFLIVADDFSDNIRVINYKINLTPSIQDENNLTFCGKVYTDIEIKANMHYSFVLYSKSLEIKDDIALINSTAEYHSRDILIDDKNYLLLVRFDNTLTKGSYTLIIKYCGSISKNLSEPFIYMTYQDKFKIKQWVLLTNINSNHAASKIFPCLHQNYPKTATFELSVQHDRNSTALSNTQYKSIITSGENRKNVWTSFAKTPLLLPRQLSLIIGNLKCATYYDKAFRVWGLKNVEFPDENLAIFGGKVWRTLKNITGVTENAGMIEKFDFVMVNGFDLPIIDLYYNYGILVMNSEMISYIKYHSNAALPTEFEQQISFVICIQWYPMYKFHANTGNEALLYYGLITYLILVTSDQTNEPEHAIDDIIYQVIDSHQLDIRLIKILHTVGKVNFRSLLHDFALESHSGELEDNYLVTKFSKALNVDILTFLEYLGSQIPFNGYSLLKITRKNITNTAAVSQRRFSKILSENSTEKYWIPLNCATEKSPNFDNTSIDLWVNPDSEETEISVAAADNEWIICNKQLIGNYRVNYDERNWKLILEYLKTANYSKIHPVNRGQVVDDILTLAKYGYVNHSLAFDLTEYLLQETHRFPLVKFMSHFFDIHDSWFSKTSDFHRDFEEHYLFREAEKLARIFCNGIREADQRSWDRLFKVYHNYKQIGVLTALGCSSNKVILNKYMNMVLNDEFMRSNYIVLVMFQSIADKSIIGVDSVLDFLINLQKKKNMSRDEEKFIVKGMFVVKDFVKCFSQSKKFSNILMNGKDYFKERQRSTFFKIALRNVHLSSLKFNSFDLNKCPKDF